MAVRYYDNKNRNSLNSGLFLSSSINRGSPKFIKVVSNVFYRIPQASDLDSSNSKLEHHRGEYFFAFIIGLFQTE